LRLKTEHENQMKAEIVVRVASGTKRGGFHKTFIGTGEKRPRKRTEGGIMLCKTKEIGLVLVCLSAALSVAACGNENGNGRSGEPVTSLPQGSEPVDLSPAEFTTEIDNPYLPFAPGSKWVYRETATDGTVQRVEITATHRTKMIANGIEALVVHDVVTEKGEPVEITDDWYAQDSAGNVWYLGEATAEYRNGKVVSHAGAWEAGVDGAQPGIVMPADPQEGMAYRQEYYAGEAEDKAEILSLDEQVEVPFGHFTDVVMTKDLVPLEPKVLEHKFFAPGVGMALVLDVSGAAGREELIRYTAGK